VLEHTVLTLEITRRAGGRQSGRGIAEGIDVCDHGCFRGAMRTLLATLPPRFKQVLTRSSCAPATVRYTCVQKGAGTMCGARGAHCGVLAHNAAARVQCPVEYLERESFCHLFDIIAIVGGVVNTPEERISA
jgi:hypothetical protein